MIAMRVFIATKLTHDFTNELTSAREYLKKELGNGIKWVNPENLHITYAFLGDVSPDKCEAVIRKMKANEFEKFSISAGNIGCFPVKGKPRIIWLGINKGAGKLEEVAQELRDGLVSEDFIFKNKFSSHITLGRARGEKINSASINKVFGQALKLIDGNLSFKVSNIELVESILSSKGPLYKSVFKVELI